MYFLTEVVLHSHDLHKGPFQKQRFFAPPRKNATNFSCLFRLEKKNIFFRFSFNCFTIIMWTAQNSHFEHIERDWKICVVYYNFDAYANVQFDTVHALQFKFMDATVDRRVCRDQIHVWAIVFLIFRIFCGNCYKKWTVNKPKKKRRRQETLTENSFTCTDLTFAHCSYRKGEKDLQCKNDATTTAI